MTTDPQTDCPNCHHDQHLPGTDCDAVMGHGPNRWHRCLCLARPGAALSCPPQMTCQGGTLGYADIWYLQQGHSLSSADGVISPEVLTVGPVAVGFPSVDEPACSDPIECGHEAALGQAQQEVRRLRLMVDEYGAGASALTDKLKRVRDLHRETCIAAKGDVSPTAFTCGMCEVLDAPAAVVLPAPVDQAAVLRELIAEAEECDGHITVQELRRMARKAEPASGTPQPETQAAHSCGNCEGIDPDTCFMNPGRPPEQCPAAEFVDYGQQCQKSVGHELHTFEEPAVVAEPGKENDPRTVCICGHTRGEHIRIGGPFGQGRLLCDSCDPDSTENLACKEFEAL